MIAEETGVCDPTDAFVAGLLHDIGYIVLKENGNDHVRPAGVVVPVAIRPAGNSATPQEDHAEIGAWLIERWKLDSGVAEAIRYHHRPSSASQSEALVAVVHIAEVLCHHLHIGEAAYESVAGYEPAALEVVDLDEAALTGRSDKGYVALFLEKISMAPKFESLVHDLKKNLVEVMEELSEQQRLVIALYYYEGLSLAEVSKMLNISITDVEYFQETSLARLRAAVSLMV
jgi:RNA polymerase sigma factor (sigma-70 family)